MQRHVVILSGHSLFAEGVASRLRQHPQRVNLEVVDVRHSDAMSQLTSARPSAVILDATDPDVDRLCLLARLQLALPGVKVICLDPAQKLVQVMTSEQLPAGQICDLLNVIEQVSS